MRVLHVKVAGTSFEDRQQTLAMMQGTEVARIVPEPDNVFDKNALAVYVAFPPESNMGIKHVGYIPRQLAAEIAPALGGEAMMVSVAEVIGGFETSDGELANYGLRLKIELPTTDDLSV